MTKVSKEFKIGIAFLLAIFLLYYGISFLKGVNIFKSSDKYMVVFDDVSGLSISSPVTVNGLQVGLVNSMEMDPNNPKRVIAYISLNKNVKIPRESNVVMDVSMLGSSTLILEPGAYENGFLTTNDTIIGSRKKGLMDTAGDMAPQIGDLLPKIDSILIGLQMLVNNPALTSTMSNLDQSMGNINAITSDLAKSTKQLNATVTSLNKDVPTITGNLVSATNQFKTMDLNSTYRSIDSTMKNIESLSSKMNRKDNTFGLLFNDRQLYDSINSTMNNASILLKDVKENPSRYINVKVF